MEQIRITADDFGLLEQEPEGWHPRYGFRLPDFDIVSNPTINLTDLRIRRFHIIDEMQESAREEIQTQEDERIFEALDYSFTSRSGLPIMARRLVEDAESGSQETTEALQRYVERWSGHMRRNERIDITGR